MVLGCHTSAFKQQNKYWKYLFCHLIIVKILKEDSYINAFTDCLIFLELQKALLNQSDERHCSKRRNSRPRVPSLQFGITLHKIRLSPTYFGGPDTVLDP